MREIINKKHISNNLKENINKLKAINKKEKVSN